MSIVDLTHVFVKKWLETFVSSHYENIMLFILRCVSTLFEMVDSGSTLVEHIDDIRGKMTG